MFILYLETERLILREPVNEDIDFWFKLKSDEKVMYYLDDLLLTNIDDARKDLAMVIADIANPERTMYFLIMVEKASGEPIGCTGYTVESFTPAGKSVHVGYFMHSKCHGKGYMPEAVKGLIKYAFEEHDVYRVTSSCLAENIPSERVMQKSGMTKEAYQEKHDWHDGKLKDRVRYRILKEEYERGKNSISGFWRVVDKLVAESKIIVDRPKGSSHPQHNFTYKVDYGYLENTKSMDGGGIDIWQGSLADEKVDAIICTVDLFKKDSEIKLLIGCTEEEKQTILNFHNETDIMKGVMIRRWDR